MIYFICISQGIIILLWAAFITWAVYHKKDPFWQGFLEGLTFKLWR